MKIYTKTGDDGTTSLQGNKRIAKSNLRIRAYGTIDELNAFLGIINSKRLKQYFKQITTEIQNNLFVLGSDLSNPDLGDKKNRIDSHDVINLEGYIDELDASLPKITFFIIPGGAETAALFHYARSISRRAETLVVSLSEKEKVNEHTIRYLNRLSDLLFVMARKVNYDNEISDIPWKNRNRI